MTLFGGSEYGYILPPASYAGSAVGEFVTLDKFNRLSGSAYSGPPLLDATFGGDLGTSNPLYVPHADEVPVYIEFIINATAQVQSGKTVAFTVRVLPPGGVGGETLPEEIDWDVGVNGPAAAPPGTDATFPDSATIHGYPLQLPPEDRPLSDLPRLWSWAEMLDRTGFLVEAVPSAGAGWLDFPDQDPVRMRATPWYDVTFPAGYVDIGTPLSGVRLQPQPGGRG